MTLEEGEREEEWCGVGERGKGRGKEGCTVITRISPKTRKGTEVCE